MITWRNRRREGLSRSSPLRWWADITCKVT
nr:MAG TPA: hypothetical protein [Caudoviricetes sp.]